MLAGADAGGGNQVIASHLDLQKLLLDQNLLQLAY